MVIIFKLTDEELKKGVEWTELDYLRLIKVCHLRNTTLYKKLVEDYEFLTGVKFKEEWTK